MIKRIVGLLAAAAIIAVIVFTILDAGSYTSYIRRRTPAAKTVETPAAAPGPRNSGSTPGETVRTSPQTGSSRPHGTAAADSVATAKQQPAAE